MAEERETCRSCGHPMSECRDPATAGTWRVHEEICQASVVSQATADNYAEDSRPRRGLQLYTSRSGG